VAERIDAKRVARLFFSSLLHNPQLASFNGMSSNSQRLDKRELIKRQQV
jgi:hypothetical protein